MQAKRNERSVVASGKTVDDAIANGLAMLDVRRDQVEVKVLSEGSRGVLGFGAENARVQLSVKPPAQPKKPPVPVREPAPIPAPVREPVAESAPEPSEAPEVQEPAQAAEGLAAEELGREHLTRMLELMGIPAKVELQPGYELAEEGQDPPTVLNITGEDLGILIGRRGETLRAMQYLVRLMISHRLKHWTDLVVDVENYRVRRRQTLENLAQRVAERVAQEGKPQALEPMPAYERRLVHIALRNHPQVTTQSMGQGERRKVTILPRR